MAFTRPAATVAASNEEHDSQLVTPNRVLLFAFCCAALTANLSSRQAAQLVAVTYSNRCPLESIH
jgi:hypothetical protein